CVSIKLRLRSPAPEILDFLTRNPNAWDTFEGVSHWVTDSCVENCVKKLVPKIPKALEKLVKNGFVEAKPRAGRMRYRLSRSYLSKLHQRSPRSSTHEDDR